MQLPLTKADFKKNSITRIARSLMKVYPEGHKIFLERAKMLVVNALGYKDIYEAKLRALDSNKMIAGSHEVSDYWKKASDVIYEFTGVKFDGSSLPLHMLDALRPKRTGLDPKIWYRIEKKFCGSFLGSESPDGFQQGKVFDFLADNINPSKINYAELSLPVSDALYQLGDTDSTTMSDKFVGMAFELLNTIVDNDESNGLVESDRMWLFKSFFERHFITTISQSLGSLYLDSPHNWCELYWFASSEHNGHVWRKVSIEDGVEFTFRLYGFERSCKSLEAYNWVCSVADLKKDPDEMSVIRSVVKGSVLKKKKPSIDIDELDFISLLDAESDQTTAMLFGLVGKLKLRRLSELSSAKLIFGAGAYMSDASYLNEVFSGSTAVVIEEIAVKSYDYNLAASTTINYGLTSILEKFGNDLSVYLGSTQAGADKYRPIDSPFLINEFKLERQNSLLNTMTESNGNPGIRFFDLDPI